MRPRIESLIRTEKITKHQMIVRFGNETGLYEITKTVTIQDVVYQVNKWYIKDSNWYLMTNDDDMDKIVEIFENELDRLGD